MATSEPSTTDDNWTELDVDAYDHPQLITAYQRLRDGLVIALEHGTVHNHRFAVTALPENFHVDDRPIRKYGDNGYLWKGDVKEHGRSVMQEFRLTGRVESSEN